MAKQVLKDYSVHLLFLLCKGAPNVNSVKLLAHLLAQEKFHPSPAKGGEKLYVAPDIDALVDSRFHDWEVEGKAVGGLQREVAFPVLMEDFPPDKSWCAFSWGVYTREYVQIGLIGSVFVPPEEQKTYHETFAQKVLAVALKLYPLAQPVYGFIADPDFDPAPWPYDSVARGRKIVTLDWVNFFGPEYVDKYGREMLAGIPGCRTQDLPDGGLLYQSRPSIVVEDEEAHKRWRLQALGYLASHGIQIRFDFP